VLRLRIAQQVKNHSLIGMSASSNWHYRSVVAGA
jgi:hypothetical protein